MVTVYARLTLPRTLPWRRALPVAMVMGSMVGMTLLSAACKPGASTTTREAPSTSSPSGKYAETGDAGASVSSSPSNADAGANTVQPGAPNKRAVRVVVARDDGDALSLVRTERLRAKADGRVLVVFASASWCEPCRQFKDEIRAGRLDEALGDVTLLAFDADRDADRLASAGYTFRFIPYVALPGADGRPVASEEATGKGGDAWRALLGKLEAWQRRDR